MFKREFLFFAGLFSAVCAAQVELEIDEVDHLFSVLHDLAQVAPQLESSLNFSQSAPFSLHRYEQRVVSDELLDGEEFLGTEYVMPTRGVAGKIFWNLARIADCAGEAISAQTPEEQKRATLGAISAALKIAGEVVSEDEAKSDGDSGSGGGAAQTKSVAGIATSIYTIAQSDAALASMCDQLEAEMMLRASSPEEFSAQLRESVGSSQGLKAKIAQDFARVAYVALKDRLEQLASLVEHKTISAVRSKSAERLSEEKVVELTQTLIVLIKEHLHTEAFWRERHGYMGQLLEVQGHEAVRLITIWMSDESTMTPFLREIFSVATETVSELVGRAIMVFTHYLKQQGESSHLRDVS